MKGGGYIYSKLNVLEDGPWPFDEYIISVTKVRKRLVDYGLGVDLVLAALHFIYIYYSIFGNY